MATYLVTHAGPRSVEVIADEDPVQSRLPGVTGERLDVVAGRRVGGAEDDANT